MKHIIIESLLCYSVLLILINTMPEPDNITGINGLIILLLFGITAGISLIKIIILINEK